MRDVNKVNKLRKECERAQEKLSELETLAEKLTGRISDMRVSAEPTPIEEWWARYIDQKDYYVRKLKAFVEASTELEKELDELTNDNIRTAMKYRYVDGLRVVDIAERMYFSERQVYTLLKRGRKQYNSPGK